MKLRTIEDWKKKDLEGARVFVRVDMNVPIRGGKVLDDWRIRASLPTIAYLRERGAKVILGTHIGRPKGRALAALRVAPVARALERLLGAKVAVASGAAGKAVERRVARMHSGEILFLENLRFHSGEEKAGVTFARELAKLADYYVNDAFATSHRASATMTLLPKFLPSRAGLLLAKEVKVLSGLLAKPKKPLFVMIGGAKVETKIGVIRAFLKRANTLALGGLLVAPFLKARGFSVGATPVSSRDLALARRLRKVKNLLLPLDVVVEGKKRGRPMIRDVRGVENGEYIRDIGPATVRRYAQEIKKARTLVWNGPVGAFEIPAFSHATKALALLIAARSRGKAFGVAGGGETVQVLRERSVAEWVDWVSTGGGAMLEFLEGKRLPGIAVLKPKA